MLYFKIKINVVCFIVTVVITQQCLGDRRSILCERLSFLIQHVWDPHGLMCATELFYGYRWLKHKAICCETKNSGHLTPMYLRNDKTFLRTDIRATHELLTKKKWRHSLFQHRLVSSVRYLLPHVC